MIRKILVGFILASVAILLLLWLATGGTRKIVDSARSVGSFWADIWNGTTQGGFRLPWQPEDDSLEKLIALSGTESDAEPGSPEEELSRAERDYEDIQKQMEDAKTFGEPSPHRGSVYLAEGGAKDDFPQEYVWIEAASQNSTPISIAGWSLQSALTGIRSYFPRGAEFFVLGDVNVQKDVYLNPGASAVVSSGASPIGTSFRENICTGYLGGLQTFVPSLTRNCPAPSESLPLTPENLSAYGDACYDLVQNLPSCAPPSMFSADVSPACRYFLANTISYNGCVSEYRYKTDFARDSWRVYLHAGGELWRNTHDIIRLLDAEGRTVDVVSY